MANYQFKLLASHFIIVALVIDSGQRDIQSRRSINRLDVNCASLGHTLGPFI